ncbi:hypothetical protein [Dysgonomonas sp. ZJ279]|uniref:hypothetical protein n=1 Tax=Dysgonomonas sp. ZJ279 TaxID=2709796 RepID=UPI0013EA2ED5|nr:hypothetical protein [Dysgonomonas sp. ZJ279]
MNNRKEEYPMISEKEYWEKVNNNESYKGYVLYSDGKVTFILPEVTVTSTSSNKVNRFSQFGLKTEIKYHESITPFVCESINNGINTRNRQLQAESSIQNGQIKRNVKNLLLKSIISYYQAEEYARLEKTGYLFPITNPSMILIDVSNPKTFYQKEFTKIKQKVESETLKKSDFKDNVAYAARKEIEMYFACFDPSDPNYIHFWNVKYHIGRPTGAEAVIPVWANLRTSLDSFQRGYNGDGIQNYSDGVGYFCLALADAMVLESGVAASGGMKSLGLIKEIPTGSAFYNSRSLYVQQYLKRNNFNIHPRISNPGWYDVARPRVGQLDAGHRGTTFLSNEILKTGKIGIKNYKTVYFNKAIGDKYFSIGINPWTRTIFHEAPGFFK